MTKAIVFVAAVFALTGVGPLAVAQAGVAPDGVPIPYLDDAGSAGVACVDVSFEHAGVFDAGNDDYDNVYGFMLNADARWTFSTGIRAFEFLTWAHGDVMYPEFEFEKFTVEAYNAGDVLVESLDVVDTDQVFEDYEVYSMTFDEPVVEIHVTFTAIYDDGVASSGLIPFLVDGAGCPRVDGDGYREWLETRTDASSSLTGLPDTR
jgi:hypothetical protein